MLYLRMLLFFLSFIGIYLFIKKIIKIDEKIVLPISIISITLCLYVFSIFSILKIGYYLCFISGLVFLLYFVFKKEINYKKIISIDNILLFILLIYIIFITRELHYFHYDNYTHWSLIIRLILENGNLPKTLDVLSFPLYPPGTALFVSFFSFICNNSNDGIFIIAQNIIILSFIKGIINLLKTDNVNLKRILFVLFYFFMQAFVVAFNDLLVDNVLVLVSLFIIMCILSYKEDSKKLFVILALSLTYLYFVKNAGFVLAFFFILLFYKQTHKSSKAFYLLALVFGAYFSWNAFAVITYGPDCMRTKHALNIGASMQMLKGKGIINCIKYYARYLLEIFDFKFIPNILFWIINVLLIIMLVVLRKHIKEELKTILKVDLIYLLYFLGLGFVYIFSMTINESNYYACYERYMMVPIVLMIFYLIYVAIKDKNKCKIIVYCLCLFVGIIFNINNLKPFIGIDGYKGSRMDKYDRLIQNVDISNKKVGIYTLDNNYDDFLFCYSIYRLRNKDFAIIDNSNIFYYDILDMAIVFDNLDSIESDLLERGYYKIDEYIYSR